MVVHKQDRSRRNGATPSPAQQAALYEQALLWRAEWEQEVARRRAAAKAPAAEAPAVAPEPRTRNGGEPFAIAVTRAEFGRFYFDHRKEARAGRRSGKGTK